MSIILNGIELPVSLRLHAPMNDEELMRFCAANRDLRIEREPNGGILVMSSTGGKTSKTNSRLTRLFDAWSEADGRGHSFESSGGFKLNDTSVRSPDVAWVEGSRWEGLTDQQQSGLPPLCPDFIIELRSPSDSLSELRKKMEEWLANGARLGWLIDPSRKVVEVYRPGQKAEVLKGARTVEGEGPVAGFVLELERVWA